MNFGTKQVCNTKNYDRWLTEMKHELDKKKEQDTKIETLNEERKKIEAEDLARAAHVSL